MTPEQKLKIRVDILEKRLAKLEAILIEYFKNNSDYMGYAVAKLD